VGRGDGQRRKVGAEQEGFAIFQDHIAIADVGFPGAQGFDFPALQGKTSLVFIFDKYSWRARLFSAMVADPGLWAFSSS
jgi:hypothetical protein